MKDVIFRDAAFARKLRDPKDSGELSPSEPPNMNAIGFFLSTGAATGVARGDAAGEGLYMG